MTTTSWKHRLGFEVEMVFDGQGWQCRCEALNIEVEIRNQAAQDFEQTLEDWINSHLRLKKASGIVSPPKTIWDIMSQMVEGGEVVIAPRGRLVIFERGANSVSLFHDRDGRLRLVAKNGKITTSEPVAYNPLLAPAGEWHLASDARRVYEEWAQKVSPKEARRPLWQFRPAVDGLMRRHNLSRDVAAEMYKERN